MTHKCSGDPPEFIRQTLSIIGDKWTALILRRLHEGPKRFSDFEKEIVDINPRTLSQRLDKLIASNIIEKTTDETRGIYKLSKAGEELDAVIHQMALWGKKHSTTPSEHTSR